MPPPPPPNSKEAEAAKLKTGMKVGLAALLRVFHPSKPSTKDSFAVAEEFFAEADRRYPNWTIDL